MNRQGDAHVSKILKLPLVLAVLLSILAQPVLASEENSSCGNEATVPAQTPVQLGWDRVGDREHNWA